MNLMSENDWHSIEVSLRKRREIVLYRERAGGAQLEVRTEAVASRAWNTDMLVGVIFRNKGNYQRQWLATLQEAKAAVDELLRLYG